MDPDSQPVVYLLASHRNGTLYTGVTSNLLARLTQHREALSRGFTAEHGIKRLMWFEVHEEMTSAIEREKRIKKWLRAWKIALIEAENPNWRDLAIDLGFDMAPSTRFRHPRESGDPTGKTPPDQYSRNGFPPARE